MRQERAMLIKQEFSLIPIQIPMLITLFPRIIAGVDYFFFRTKRGQLFEGVDYFEYYSLDVVPEILGYFIHYFSIK